QHNRPVASELKLPQQHQRHQVPDLEAGRSGVEAAVQRAATRGEVRREVPRGVVHEAPPVEFGQEVGHGAESYGNPPPLASAERPLTEIPLPVRQAFIATEDKRFYDHHGIDYWRILGAIKNDLVTMSFAQGFSTITMQLARNIFPEEISREKTLTRKLKEARV